MLLTITTTHTPATDLGYLLHKHPDRCQSFRLSFGDAHVVYPEVSPEQTTVALLLEVDPVALVRGKQREQSSLLGSYVNDRPFVASSFLSVALAQIFGTAMAGRCKDRPELVAQPLPLVARIEALPVRGSEDFVHRIFEPLGYTVTTTRRPLDDHFPEWGESPYFTVELSATIRLSELLTHLYVLIPVFDNTKHYFVGDDELEKLLSNGAGWLADHPEKETITRRYLRHRSSLYREALARLVEEEAVEEAALSDDSSETEPTHSTSHDSPPQETESLHQQRHDAVVEILRTSGARSVVDLGCGDGRLIKQLLKERQFENITGMDVSFRSLEIANRKLRLDRLPSFQSQRLRLLHGSLTYRDDRLTNFDAAAVVEVIEHLDPPRLAAFEKVLFEFARPKTIVLTTPNREYNVKWETLPAGQFRHSDHRFEWTRQEFEDWANRVAGRHGYTVRFLPVGPMDETVGTPSQMGVFNRD